MHTHNTPAPRLLEKATGLSDRTVTPQHCFLADHNATEVEK